MPRCVRPRRFDWSAGQSDGVARVALLQLVWGALQMPSAQTRASAKRCGLRLVILAGLVWAGR